MPVNALRGVAAKRVFDLPQGKVKARVPVPLLATVALSAPAATAWANDGGRDVSARPAVLSPNACTGNDKGHIVTWCTHLCAGQWLRLAGPYRRASGRRSRPCIAGSSSGPGPA